MYNLEGSDPITGLQTLHHAHAVRRITAVQNEYSMMARDPEADILPICKELGIGFVFWSPLTVAFLAGAREAEMTPWRSCRPAAGSLTTLASA
jgi:aryl-alcohol dehydrogenase-like predicted oxidoreductase